MGKIDSDSDSPGDTHPMAEVLQKQSPQRACKRFYIMASAASGKSTFAGQNETYRGYRIIDYAARLGEYTLTTRILLYLTRFLPFLRPSLLKRKDFASRYRGSYFDQAFEFLLGHDEPVVVFGRKTLDGFDHQQFDHEVAFAMVLIPEDHHRRNCASRKSQMRNPIPFFNHWTTDFEQIQEVRDNMRRHAEKHNITIYDSFQGAIDDLHRRFGVPGQFTDPR
ncbi:MAG: hypothetical protein KJO31_16845 [Gammaproteobacteria bacterium]|nr:hypothetical protein [Gammaproteobacteria bacterium]